MSSLTGSTGAGLHLLSISTNFFSNFTRHNNFQDLWRRDILMVVLRALFIHGIAYLRYRSAFAFSKYACLVFEIKDNWYSNYKTAWAELFYWHQNGVVLSLHLTMSQCETLARKCFRFSNILKQRGPSTHYWQPCTVFATSFMLFSLLCNSGYRLCLEFNNNSFLLLQSLLNLIPHGNVCDI